MGLTYFKQRINGDFLTTGLWDFNDDPVYANITDIDPSTGLQQLTGWGVNENLREFANAIIEIHTGLGFVPQAAEPSGAGKPLQNYDGLWLSSLDDKMHFKSPSGDQILATLNDIIVLTCKNDTGAQLDKQDMVYISGCDGVNGEISLADNTDPAKQYWVGMVVADIANGATGTVRLIGELSGLNTAAFGDGDILYLSTVGALVNAIPSTGTVKPIGYCLCSHASLGKVLLVDIDYPYISAISENIDIRMGDAGGVYGIDFRDSTNTAVAFIDSNGVAYFDNIVEFTGAAGVTIDGVLLKDDTVFVDTITEKTGAAGVTIEGVLLKDSEITIPILKALYFDTVNTYIYMNVIGELVLESDNNFQINAAGSVKINANSFEADVINEFTSAAGVTIETILHKDGEIFIADDKKIYFGNGSDAFMVWDHTGNYGGANTFSIETPELWIVDSFSTWNAGFGMDANETSFWFGQSGMMFNVSQILINNKLADIDTIIYGDTAAVITVDASIDGLGVFATTPVIQQAAIADAAGGGVHIDAEARAAINSLLAVNRAYGFIAT